jgi:hypothetical protein
VENVAHSTRAQWLVLTRMITALVTSIAIAPTVIIRS